MAKTIYENNDVEIILNNTDEWESEVNVKTSGKGNLIVISAMEKNEFIQELRELLDRYRI